MFKDLFDNVKKKHPLIHNITNYVTVHDCANILIACGAAPIMADEPEQEQEDLRVRTQEERNAGAGGGHGRVGLACATDE